MPPVFAFVRHIHNFLCVHIQNIVGGITKRRFRTYSVMSTTIPFLKNTLW